MLIFSVLVEPLVENDELCNNVLHSVQKTSNDTHCIHEESFAFWAVFVSHGLWNCSLR
jgi:hypothetical protein